MSAKISSIKTAMTPFPYTIDAFAELQEAVAMMTEHKIRHLPVAREGKLIGVISDRDLKWARNLTDELGNLKVGELVRENLYAVDLNERLDKVLLAMAEKQIGSALVVKGEKLAGIFTTTDACRQFAEYLQRDFPDPDADPALA